MPTNTLNQQKSWKTVLQDLEKGKRRAAFCKEGKWEVDISVKEAILSAFKESPTVRYRDFFDKADLLPREFDQEDAIRMVPRGTSIRKGSYIGKNVVIMPPSFVNVGVYVDEDTMIDSHVLVGSCAQIGKRVHLSAGVQIGGVLEPIGQKPVIIEDDAFIGAGATIVEGILVKKGAVIGPGVSLSKSLAIYDVTTGSFLDKGAPVPENAVVVPGSRPINQANEHGIQLYCPVIVKYKDAKTKDNLNLEASLRNVPTKN
ncbi:MAG: 2,3,4,5-tetrahydropyridine-2,6-dicarboxylate N-succinyltransferase [Chlamydiales bacterium]|nr:2,3,4,5-tetrahydropyridine-2,6-dicarboxylate N-succinyltransferase [Chlamydiales bacterium]